MRRFLTLRPTGLNALQCCGPAFSGQRLRACPDPQKPTVRSFPESPQSHRIGSVNCSYPYPPSGFTLLLCLLTPLIYEPRFSKPAHKGTKEVAALAEGKSRSFKRSTAVWSSLPIACHVRAAFCQRRPLKSLIKSMELSDQAVRRLGDGGEMAGNSRGARSIRMRKSVPLNQCLTWMIILRDLVPCACGLWVEARQQQHHDLSASSLMLLTVGHKIWHWKHLQGK